MSVGPDHSQADRTSDQNIIPDTAGHWQQEFAALRAIAEGTAAHVGDKFFPSLIRHLTQALGVQYGFVAEFAGTKTRARTLAYWSDGQMIENIEWDLAGTPCEEVVRGHLCHYPQGVWQRFLQDEYMVQEKIESYLGVPLMAANGESLGHLAVFDKQPLLEEPRLLSIFRIFASRAAAELDRVRMEQQWKASEERFRDLFEEAPIAYVHEGLDSRFLQANRAALRILGITSADVPGTYGKSFAPQTPEAQRRIEEAFASIGRGIDTSGVVLELRRKDTGQPIWIQWWSKPDPGGQFTRTMFIDITDRVLMEQEQQRLRAQNAYLQDEIKEAHNFEEIIGRSPAILHLLTNVRRVAITETSVLIRGETGTGKELIARAIHSASPRRDKPLIKINCAALPEGLVESELFGHEKGAFTGALGRRAGRFELADGGTIFLDEIGEIPLEAQAKLLRVLQEREFDRVGGTSTIKVDVRVIAATNRDLLKAVADRTFREDLYYRLNVFPLVLPPLRERGDDLPLLVQFLINRFSKRLGRAISGIDDASLALLQSYRWPGNIRELENVIERAIILSDGPVLEIDPEMLPGSDLPTSDAMGQNPMSLEALECQHILKVLQETDWVIEGAGGAARILDLHPNTLRSRMKKWGIVRPS
ncbi:PAS domain S-box protein [bacterium]|nr:PAS domain S-box protein [bacterium]